MYLLIILLQKSEYLDDILQSFVEVGITDATVMESQSMSNFLAFDIPIFAGLKYKLQGEQPMSKIIFAVSEDLESVDYLVKILKNIGIEMDKPGVLKMMTIKIESAYGKGEEFDYE